MGQTSGAQGMEKEKLQKSKVNRFETTRPTWVLRLRFKKKYETKERPSKKKRERQWVKRSLRLLFAKHTLQARLEKECRKPLDRLKGLTVVVWRTEPVTAAHVRAATGPPNHNRGVNQSRKVLRLTNLGMGHDRCNYNPQEGCVSMAGKLRKKRA